MIDVHMRAAHARLLQRVQAQLVQHQQTITTKDAELSGLRDEARLHEAAARAARVDKEIALASEQRYAAETAALRRELEAQKV